MPKLQLNRWAKSIKVIVHELLFIISILLTCALFWLFANKVIFSIIWLILGFSLEGLKRYLTMVCKAKYSRKDWWSFIGNFGVYIPIAFISAVASLGFSLVTIHYQSMQTAFVVQIEFNRNQKIIESYQAEIDRYRADLEDYNIQIDSKNEDIQYERDQIEIIDDRISINTNKLSDLSVWASETEDRLNTTIATDEALKNDKKENVARYMADIEFIREQMQVSKNHISELNAQILEIETEKAVEDIQDNSGIRSMDVFDMIGERLPKPVEGRNVLFFLMFILVIILEVALFITTEELSDEERFAKGYPRLVDYVSALIDVIGDMKKVPLNTDKDISNKTGIDVDDCREYRKFLQSINYRDTPLIYEKKGKTYANYTKENFITLARNRSLYSN